MTHDEALAEIKYVKKALQEGWLWDGGPTGPTGPTMPAYQLYPPMVPSVWTSQALFPRFRDQLVERLKRAAEALAQ